MEQKRTPDWGRGSQRSPTGVEQGPNVLVTPVQVALSHPWFCECFWQPFHHQELRSDFLPGPDLCVLSSKQTHSCMGDCSSPCHPGGFWPCPAEAQRRGQQKVAADKIVSDTCVKTAPLGQAGALGSASHCHRGDLGNQTQAQ